LFFQPSAQIFYGITNKWEVYGSWFFYNQNPDLRTLYSGYILQNYRTLSRFENKLTDSHGNGGSLKLSFKDIMSFLFTSLELNYNHYRNEVMYAQQFEGSVLKTTMLEMGNSGYYLSLTGRASKGFEWKKLSFSVDGSWGKGLSPQLRQGKLIQYVNSGLNANMIASLAITGSILFANKCSWSRITGSTGTGENFAPISNFIDAASLDITLPAGFVFRTAFEYYDSRFGETIQNFYLADAGITYTLKRVRFNLDCTNLLNTKNYVYSYYGSLNSFYSEYAIRPRTIVLKVQFKLF
jgi:hypothetical protein